MPLHAVLQWIGWRSAAGRCWEHSTRSAAQAGAVLDDVAAALMPFCDSDGLAFPLQDRIATGVQEVG